jgi:hypothetical protein
VKDKIVAISVSDGPDLQLFGYLPQHLRRLLASLAVASLRANWRIGYGGDLRRDGFTRSLLADTAAAFGRGQISGQPQASVVHFFALSAWREMPGGTILNHLMDRELGPGDAPIAPVTETRFFLPSTPDEPQCIAIVVQDGGLRLAGSDEPVPEARLLDLLGGAAQAPPAPGRELTVMRRAMARACPLRIQFSGKISRYAGDRPGLIEEAIEQVRAGGIVMPLGGFGGAAREIAIALGLLRAERTLYPEYGNNYEQAFEELTGLAGQHERQAGELMADLAQAAEIGTPHRIVFHLNAVLGRMGNRLN